jgi:hypothetical protein
MSGNCHIVSAMQRLDVITTGPNATNGSIPQRLTRPAIEYNTELLLVIRQSKFRNDIY